MALLVSTVLGWIPVPVVNDQMVFMPGSQPDPANDFLAPGNCGCHEINQPYSIYNSWKGSMMAQAGRDPLWLASVVVAEQDSIWLLGNPNGGDLCIRCHSPTGWLEGRSDPVNLEALLQNDKDFEGVHCMFCHSMVDPLTELNPGDDAYLQDLIVLGGIQQFNGTPFLNSTTNLPEYYGDGTFPNYTESGGGSFFVDVTTFRRGSRPGINPPHDFYYDDFQLSEELCHTCHDVSNPAIARAQLGMEVPEVQAAASFAHVERTSSEFALSAYGQGGASTNVTGVPFADKCQDCHMRDSTGKATNSADTYTDFGLHDLTGGNEWIGRMIASTDSGSPNYDQYNFDIFSGVKYPGAQLDLTGVSGYGEDLLEGADRALQNLQDAANLTYMAEDAGTLTLRIQNNGGHKLISGYPEGRRMFLNVEFYDDSWNLLGQINPYEDLVITNVAGNDVYVSGGNLTVTNDELVYECVMSSSFTGESHTRHFLLADGRYKDNRIPPKGFNTSGMFDRIVQPTWEGADAPDYFTVEEYAGGYDEVTFNKPGGTVYWNTTLYYQTTSKEYIEFLKEEINGTASTLISPTPSGEPEAYIVQTDPFFDTLKDWGDAMWDLWLHNNGSAPVRMTTLNGMSVVTPANHTISLNEGWNLISVPFEPGDEALDQVLANISGKWDNVQAYDPQLPLPWLSNNTNRPTQLNTLDSLNHTNGFWINITEPGVDLFVEGFELSNTNIPLKAGWNLVGYPSLNTTRTVAEALAGTGYDGVEGYNASEPYRLGTLADTYVMQPGEAYWVHVPFDSTWTVTNSPPTSIPVILSSIGGNNVRASEPEEVQSATPEHVSPYSDLDSADDGYSMLHSDIISRSETLGFGGWVMVIPLFAIAIVIFLRRRR